MSKPVRSIFRNTAFISENTKRDTSEGTNSLWNIVRLSFSVLDAFYMRDHYLFYDTFLNSDVAYFHLQDYCIFSIYR